jgi:hypothetical protein
MAINDWEGLGLHHWSMIALLYGDGAPEDLDESLLLMVVDARLAKVASVLGLTAERPSLTIPGPGGTNSVTLNARILDKMREPEYAHRAAIVPWVPHAIQNAVEIWRQTVTPKNGGPTEARTYYLAPLAFAEQNECYMAISGEDGVAFNVMRARATYANKMRNGELIYARAASTCVNICCKRYLELRGNLVKANAEVLELRQKNRKLKDALKRT